MAGVAGPVPTREEAVQVLQSQYNEELQPQFASYRTATIALIEKEDVREILLPLLREAKERNGGNAVRVLEIACGSGFYTFDLLSWGADRVTAVDLSADMIGAAEARAKAAGVTAVDFQIADISVSKRYGDEPFDLVFGAWPLEYAKDRAALVAMYANVAANLKTGGCFVVVTRVPDADPRAVNEATNRLRPRGGGQVLIQNLESTPEGVLVRLYAADAAHKDVSFVCIHWNRETYESAARDAGLLGELSWTLTRVPEKWLATEAAPGGASREEILSYREIPEYGILKVRK